MSITIYHYARCTKSRDALKLLEEKQGRGELDNFELEVVDYHKTTPSTLALKKMVEYLGWNNIDKSEKPWQNLLRPDAKKEANSWDEAYDLIQKNPDALERPFVIDWDGETAALGRPDLTKVKDMIAKYL